MNRFLASLLIVAALASFGSAQSVWTTVKQWDSGPSDERLDIVVMGDGYTAAQIPVFRTHVTNFINHYFNQDPIKQYKHLVNIWRIEVESVESGSDKPGPCYNPPVFKNTELDGTYCTGGTQRCITSNTAKAQATALLNVPDWDEILVFVNDTEYGGCAGSISTSTGANSSASEVATHELGHSIMGLADEYGGAGTYTGGQFSQVNASNIPHGSFAGTKWDYWVGIEGVSSFEGCRYNDFGAWRPRNSCKMRSLGGTFCAVCREKHLEMMWQHVTAPDAVNPPTVGAQSASAVLSADAASPTTGSLQGEWSIDGTFASNGSQSLTNGIATFSFVPSTVLGPTMSTHTVTLRVFDTTNWYRKQPTFEVISSTTWTVTDDITDLEVTAFSVDQVPARNGDLFAVTDTVVNNGPQPTAAARIGYYIASSAGDIDTNGVLCGTRMVPALMPGQSDTASTGCRVPHENMLGGTLVVGAFADDEKTVLESDEVNNIMTAPGTVSIDTSPSLTLDISSMQWQTGSVGHYTIDIGAAHAGELYYLLPSVAMPAETSLGPLVGSLRFTFDDLSDQVANFVLGPPFFNNFVGFLDANGRATPDFNKPPVFGVSTFLVVYHTFLTVGNDPNTGAVTVPNVGNLVTLLVF